MSSSELSVSSIWIVNSNYYSYSSKENYNNNNNINLIKKHDSLSKNGLKVSVNQRPGEDLKSCLLPITKNIHRKTKMLSSNRGRPNLHVKEITDNKKIAASLIKTVEFDRKGSVNGYDKNVFSIKNPDCLLMDNIKISLTQTTDETLKNFAIASIKGTSGKMKILVKKEQLLNMENVLITNVNDLMLFFMSVMEENKQIVSDVTKSVNLIGEVEKNELQVMASQKADELAKQFLETKWDLTYEMEQCGLVSEDIELIKDHCAGMCHITTFLQEIDIPDDATIIGLNHKSIIETATDTLGCKDYLDAYQRIFGSTSARDDFLEELTKDPTPIIFLVPHKLFGSKQGVTANEMKWLLANPKQMKNVIFIFGAYRIFSKKIVKLANLEENQAAKYTDYLAERIFQQIQCKLNLPTPKINLEIRSELENLIGKFQVLNLKPFKKPEKAHKIGIGHIDALTVYKEPVIDLGVNMSKKDIVHKAITYPTQTKQNIDSLEKSTVQIPTTCCAPSIEDLDDFDISITDSPCVISELAATINHQAYAIFLMGGSGSGKGTIRDELVSRHPERNYVIIDPDLIKEAMSDYKELLESDSAGAASVVHDQSVKKASELLENTIQAGKSFIYDSTGSRSWIYAKQMAAAKDKGMVVKLIYVETKVENCLKRAHARAKEDGRVVPTIKIEDTNFYAAENFDELKELAHQWKKYNNDGEKPQLVSSLI